MEEQPEDIRQQIERIKHKIKSLEILRDDLGDEIVDPQIQANQGATGAPGDRSPNAGRRGRDHRRQGGWKLL